MRVAPPIELSADQPTTLEVWAGLTFAVKAQKQRE